MIRSHQTHTDADLAELDIAALLRTRLPHDPRVFAEGAITAGITLDRLGIVARSVTFLAEIVRRGGLAFALQLSEPLPTPQATELVRQWLTTAAEVNWRDQFEGGDTMARWLEGVSVVLSARQSRST